MIDHKILNTYDEPKGLVPFRAGVLNKITNKKSQGQFKIHLVSTEKEFNLYQDLKDLLDDTNINIRLGFTCLDRIQNLYQYIKGHIIIVNNSQP